MDTDYQKRLIKRLNERRTKYILLSSKRRLLEETKKQIIELEGQIRDLDNKISVLTPNETSQTLQSAKKIKQETIKRIIRGFNANK